MNHDGEGFFTTLGWCVLALVLMVGGVWIAMH